MTSGDLINGKISAKMLKQTVREFGFIHKLTITFFPSLSIINLCYYSKFPIPIMHRQFFRKNSQNKNM